MFVWMAKFGAAYGVRTGIHVGVDVMINRLPPDTRRLYVLFGLLAGALFTGDRRHARRHVRLGYRAHRPGFARPRTADVAGLPGVPLGSYLMCFRFLQVAGRFWRTGDLPRHDVAHVEGIDDRQVAMPAPASGARQPGDRP